MKNIYSCFLLLLFIKLSVSPQLYGQLLNDGWKFKHDNSTIDWKPINIPHDWSVDIANSVHFTQNISGSVATAHVKGGTAQYQKAIELTEKDKNKEIYLYFEGVYMESEVYVNNIKIKHNVYGYTSFFCDITKYCYFDGRENIILIKVKNEGKNSRWYSGSGIYRNIWLLKKEKIHIQPWEIAITTPEVTKSSAKVNVSLDIQNNLAKNKDGSIQIDILDHNNRIVTSSIQKIVFDKKSSSANQNLTIEKPSLWDITVPYLYTAKISLMTDGKVIDERTQQFGIRTISFDTENGFQLNGRTIKLKGGCIHHDNGLLGAKAIDRAEERKIEILLANGYNAIRSAHNPPSEKLLETCDRLGMLVIDEAFDQWTESKNPQDYHRFFDQYSERDLASMVLRDRNHPSIIMWSIGNEIPERSRAKGVEIAKRLKEIVSKYDTTRPVTAAVNEFWDNPDLKWKDSEAAFSTLDISGYNYMHWEYENDHKLFPNRVMYGSESTAKEANINWDYVERLPYLVGDFVWTAMDYLGESGIGHSYYIHKDSTDKKQFMDWPWYNGFCGDIDICGNKKPQGYYRDVLWNERTISLFTSNPIPTGFKEKVSYWGWKQEDKVWDYATYGSTLIPVTVYTRGDKVELYINNRLVAQQPCSQQTAYTASFEVPYEAGELKAIAYKDGKIIGVDKIITPNEDWQVILTADRTIINASKNDLSFINIEICDSNGTLINTNDVKLDISCQGEGKIIASGNAAPDDMESFNSLSPKTYKGRAQAIVQPSGIKGNVELTVTSEGLQTKTIRIECK